MFKAFNVWVARHPVWGEIVVLGVYWIMVFIGVWLLGLTVMQVLPGAVGGMAGVIGGVFYDRRRRRKAEQEQT